MPAHSYPACLIPGQTMAVMPSLNPFRDLNQSLQLHVQMHVQTISRASITDSFVILCNVTDLIIRCVFTKMYRGHLLTWFTVCCSCQDLVVWLMLLLFAGVTVAKASALIDISACANIRRYCWCLFARPVFLTCSVSQRSVTALSVTPCH